MLSDESRKFHRCFRRQGPRPWPVFQTATLSEASHLFLQDQDSKKLKSSGLGALAVCGLQPSEPSFSFVSSGSSRILERCLAALFTAKPKLKASSQGMGVHGMILWCRAIPAPSRTSKNCKAVLQHACPRFLQHSETGVASSCL